MKKYQMFIDGVWKDSRSGNASVVINPATEEEIATVPCADGEDAGEAVDAARSAQKSWSRLSSLERASYLKETVKNLKKYKADLARVIVAEQGKPYKEALGEVDGAVHLLEYSAEWALRIEGDILPSFANESILIKKVPHGVVLGITPWNYPLAVPARKIGPALITGNTIVLKPHEITPLSALELAKLFELSGLPRGVLNVVTGTGRGVGECLVGHPDIEFVTMTGSVRAGQEIYSASAQRMKSLSLEMGGKAPFIIMEDVDVDVAVRHALRARFMNCGQVCICNERTYIHAKIYDEFVEKCVAAAQRIQVGDPLEPDTEMGPKISLRELQKVANMVDRARRDGAEVLTGGAVLKEGAFSRGFWYPPTVVTGATADMDIMKEEIFGPVLPLIKINDLEEAIVQANDSTYGLSAYLFGNDYRKIMRAVESIDYGEVFVNRSGAESFHAYHSGYRFSGVGGDDGKYGIEHYLRKKSVYLNYE